MRLARTALLLASLLLPAIFAAYAMPIDLHAYWDDRCASCHGDAGAFARRTLRVEGDGRLAGAHHKDDLALFLRQHYLADDLVAPVSRMLAAQAASPAAFRERCAGCHRSAAAFARTSLALKDGVLVGRDSGRPVSAFLRAHGGLAEPDIAPMTATLARVLDEVSTAR